jgi:transcriptional regulator
MLIHPWDAATDDTEWRHWLESTPHFGVLAVNNADPARAPLVLPLHFALKADEILLHLARPNPVWPHLQAAREVRLAVTGDHAYVPGYWRAKAGDPDDEGVPTSYYTSVQFVCRPTVVDDPNDKAEILATQLAAFQPEGRHAVLEVDTPPYGPLLSGIRGVRLKVLGVEAKFKYDDAKPVEHRERVIGYLEQRGSWHDIGAARQQRRRLLAIGDWRDSRGRE